MRYCSQCGISEDDDYDNYLVDFTLTVADGEEGFAQVTQFICGNCHDKMAEALIALGFKDHRHGGINFLEAKDCGGWSKCQNPSIYGQYFVGQDPPQDLSDEEVAEVIWLKDRMKKQ